MHESLTDAVLEFQRSGLGLGSLLDRISVFVYSYPRTRLSWTEDDCGDFFCFFHPRLRRLIDRFEFHGKPFEVYLIVTLKWQLRTYAGRRATEHLRSRVVTHENFWACESSDDYPSPELSCPSTAELSTELSIPTQVHTLLKMDERNRIKDHSCKRRVLFLALKSAIRMTETLIQKTALITGYDADWIYELTEELRLRVKSRRSRWSILSEKRNRYFFRIYCLQEQLRLVSEEQVRREISRQLLQEGKRLSKALDAISHVPVGPTHRDIADVLGVPKGTVDSGLYYLKDSLRMLS
jgi:hypothetical protein